MNVRDAYRWCRPSVRGGLLRGLSLLLVVLMLTLVWPGDPSRHTVKLNYENSPEQLTLQVAEGFPVTVELEGGSITRTVVAGADGRIELPILWDGTWILTTDTESVELRVGKTPEKVESGTQMRECWLQGTLDGTGVRATREGVLCAQGLIAMVAMTGYTRAEELILDARQRLGPTETRLWGTYCHLTGGVAASMAIAGGEDVGNLLKNHDDICDYSLLHGIGAVAAFETPQNPTQGVAAVCARHAESSIPDFSYTSQCWHGGGMGFARLYRLDAVRAATACGAAEEEAFRSNCIEGVFSFVREFTLRKSSAEWRDVRVDLDYCEETFHIDARFYAACYRSVALDQRQLIGKDAKLEDLTTGFYPELQAACAKSAQEARRLACWESVGQFVAPFILADDDPKGAAKTWMPVCRKAVGESKTQCYQRLVFELVKTDQRPSGLAQEYLLELLPEEVHEIVEPRLESWLDSLVGRGV